MVSFCVHVIVQMICLFPIVFVYISGISYDWIDSILYMSDSKGDIYAINIDTKVVIGIHTDLDNPRAILVVPLERYLRFVGMQRHTKSLLVIGISGMMFIHQRTSDGGNGNHIVSLPIILIKIKVDQLLSSSFISSLLVYNL